MNYNNLTYVIVNTSNVTNLMIAMVNQTSLYKCRKSNDGSKCLLSWEGIMPWSDNKDVEVNGVLHEAQPSPFEGLTVYTHQEILEELAGNDWN